MDNKILVGVVHSRADLQEKFDALAKAKRVTVAVFVERDAVDVFGDQIGFPGGTDAAIE